MVDLSLRQHVEQFHLLLLDQLSRKLDKRLYALKGGCNLRFFFNSVRYSEDIDIDVNIIQKQTLQKNVEQILNSTPFAQVLRTKQMSISDYSAPKQTETTQRWKIALSVEHSAIPLRTKLEFSRRKHIAGVKLESITPEILQQYHLSPLLINHYDINAALVQKIEALIGRTQTQARDVFDLSLLLQSGADLNAVPKSLRGDLEVAQTNALAITYSTFKSQVLSFLPPDYQAQYDSKNTWEGMMINVVEALGKLIK